MFHTSAEERVDQERRDVCRVALRLIDRGEHILAAELILDSVHKQARWTPVDTIKIKRTYVWPAA